MNASITNLPKEVSTLIINQLPTKALLSLKATCSKLKNLISNEVLAKSAFAEIVKEVNKNGSCAWTRLALKQISPKEANVSEDYLRVILPYINRLSEFSGPYFPLLDILQQFSINIDAHNEPCICQVALN